jgi:hypothetical protein
MEHLLINVPVLTNAVKVERTVKVKDRKTTAPPQDSIAHKVAEPYYEPNPLDCSGT